MTNIQKSFLNFKRLFSNIFPEIKNLSIGQLFCNAEKTADEKAASGKSWREYWQIFTQDDFPTTCPFCGKFMTEDEVDGCHIIMRDVFFGHWSEKKFIIPGHHQCNMQQDGEFKAKIAVKAVEAIEK